MTETEFRFLDGISIDPDRVYIEFEFSDIEGRSQAIQIDFANVEALAALFQQAFLSATLANREGPNRHLGREWITVPRADIDHPVSVGVDSLSGRVIAMFLLGSPFQVCYSLPAENARTLSRDLLAATEEVVIESARPLN